LLVINLKSEKVLWSSKLELGDVALLVLLDGDSVSLWKMLLLSSHDLDEVLQVLDFLWLLQNKMSVLFTYHYVVPLLIYNT
jgi:hypothetical protein